MQSHVYKFVSGRMLMKFEDAEINDEGSSSTISRIIVPSSYAMLCCKDKLMWCFENFDRRKVFYLLVIQMENNLRYT